jgi:hypothetical protein
LVPDGATEIDVTANFSTSEDLNSGGVELILNFWDNVAGDSPLATQTATQSTTVAGTEYTLTTSAVVPPANTSYCTATLQLVGSPSSDCILRAYNLQVQNTNNSSLQPILNSNYAFMSGLSGWTAVNNANVQAFAGPFTSDDGAVNSLVIDGTIELMGGAGGVECTISELIDPATGEGPRFRISAPGGTMSLGTSATGFFDLGAPQPTQDIVESMLLDGERPFGRRASNRTLSIPVVIFARSLRSMAAAREYLLRTIDKQVFQITWTPASTGLPMILDCFRAQPSVITYGFNYDRDPADAAGQGNGAEWAITQVTINVQALPYGRSGIDGVQNLELESGEVGGSPAQFALTADDFTTVNSMDPYTDNGSVFQNGGWRKNTASTPGTAQDGYISPASAEFVSPTPMWNPLPRAIYENLNAFDLDISGHPVMSMWVGLSWNDYWAADPKFKAALRMNWTLYDASGHSLSFDVNPGNIAWGAESAKPVWTRRTGNIPQNNTTFDYNHVTGYKIIAANSNLNGLDRLVKLKLWMNGINFYPNSVAEANAPRSAVYNLRGITGMARSPISAYLTQPSQAPQTVEITKSGTWLVPSGVTSVAVEAWGGGGGGASVTPTPTSGIPSVHGTSSTNQQNTSWNVPVTLSTNLNVPLTLAIVGGNTSSATWAVTDTQGNTWTAAGNISNTNHQIKLFTCSSPSALVAGTDSLTITSSVPITISAALIQFPDGSGISTAGVTSTSGNAEGISESSAIAHNTSDFILAIGGSNNGYKWVSTASGTPGGANAWNYAGGASSADTTLAIYSVQSTTGTYNFSTSFAGSPPVANRYWSLMFLPITSAVPYANVQPTSAGIAGGGGGGGEYAAETSVSVIPGTQVPVTIGAGGQGSQPSATVQEFKSPGTMKWTCPDGVNSILAEAWGGGAAGAAGGGGGGGGMYSSGQIVVVPGKTYSWTIGAGGKANTGTSSADNAARNGGSTTVNGEGSGQWIESAGGKSPTTGSSNGGAGGTATTGGELANPVWRSGGKGGNAPGAAGGGGGASATDFHGGTGGGNSPQAGPNGNYKTGGTGGVVRAGDTGGNGGNGANAPGTPTAGAQPGGGGGGGYAAGKNYVGGAGGNGMIRISYRTANGSKTNGGATKFGSSGLTNISVLAHGGLTPPDNTPIGGAGGTGSSNTEKFAGGTGGMQGGTTNEFMPDRATTLFTNLGTATGTGASFTSAASSAAISFGTAVIIIEASSTFSVGTNTAITDSAGNEYSLISSEAIPGGTAMLYVYETAIRYPITTSTTFSLGGNVNSVTYSAMWMASKFFQTVLKDNAAVASGTSTTPSVSYTNPIAGTVLYQMFVTANNGTATTSAFGGITGLAPAATTTLANGTQEIAISGELVPGSATAAAQSSTISASTGWAAISVPFVAANQDTDVMLLGTANGTGTSTALAVSRPVDVSSGLIAVAVETAAASTVTVTDNASGGSNTYTLRETATSTQSLKLFTAPVINPLNGATSITVTDGTSQARSVAAWFIPNATAFDTTASGTATGSGTALSVASNAATQPGELVFAVFGQETTAATFSALASGWGNAGSVSNANGSILGMFKKMQTPAALTATATSSLSGAWSGISGVFKIPFESGGGGAGGGPGGTGYGSIGGQGGAAWTDGGKGADGTIAAGAGGNAGLPGGGGSGALSTNATGAFQGGQGGAGMVRLTWQPPLRTFNDLIIHRPSPDSTAKFLNPVVDINPSDPPDNREYAVDSLTAGANAQFGGTYSVLLINHTWDTPSASRNVTVTVNQYEYKNGPVVSVQATRSLLPGRDVTNGYVDMGPLTLPIKDYDQSVSETYYTVSVHSTNANDRFQDVVFLDTMGQTVLINIAAGTAGDGRYSTYYVDEPDFDVALGKILGTGTERSRAVSVMDMALNTGGPLYIDDGDNYILAYSTAGAPNVGVSYAPRWYTDRIV